MVDITLCTSTNCWQKEKCYRFTAQGSEYQSMAEFSPDYRGYCCNFMEIRNSGVPSEGKSDE